MDMISVKEQVTQEIEGLSEAELQQVAEYLAFLKFRARTRVKPSLDETHLAARYAESSDEDRFLAEEGMEEYAKGLLAEDTQWTPSPNPSHQGEGNFLITQID